MAISSINLPIPSPTATSQVGTFTTDAAGPATAATTSSTAVNASVITIGSTAGYTGANVITVPGAGPLGAEKELLVTGASLQGAGQLTIPNPGVVTAVASGTNITRWETIPIVGRPRHVRVTFPNGDYLDWTAGMEPYSANTLLLGITMLLPKAMLCQPGALHFAPGILPVSQTYNLVVDY